MTDFEGLVAIVTGGASGIGAATAALLAQRGASVAIFDRDISAIGDGDTFAAECDVTDSAGVEKAVKAVAEKFGAIDIVINNAGVGAVGDIAANDDDEWHRVYDVNVVGIARVTRAALPYLKASSHAGVRVALLVPGVLAIVTGVVAFIALGRRDPIRSVWDYQDERVRPETT